MKPLFKWPGGKRSDLKRIRPLLPDFSGRYLEPFVGGGALYFDQEPERAVISDTNHNLMLAYKLLGSRPGNVEKAMRKFAASRKQAALFAGGMHSKALTDFKALRAGGNARSVLEHEKKAFFKLETSETLPAGDVWPYVLDALEDKFKRTLSHEKRSGKWQDKDIIKQIETAPHAGLYNFIRDAFGPKTEAEEVAKFLYIREFSYGGMFRFSADGKFNIPYGGYSYNSKSLSAKIDYWSSEPVHELLERTEKHETNFLHFLTKTKPGSSDFMFLDPPYHTEFSDYENDPFGLDDHQDLADAYRDLKCKALLVIGHSPEIEKMYKKIAGRQIKVKGYGKKYSYNVRGRNQRAAKHLIITNY